MFKINYIGYYIVSNILKLAGDIYYGAKVIGKENLPKDGSFILASNHLSDIDAYFLYSVTKRPIHILGKIELFQGKFNWFFKMMQVIPVDRSKKNPKVKEKVLNLLNNGEVVAIFPEGTYHKKDLLLPFKPGVVNYAECSNTLIIPIVIYGKLKFRGRPKVLIGKPIDINKVTKKDKVKYLEDIFYKMLIKLKKEC